MPNTFAPLGLRPVRYRGGAPYSGGANAYVTAGATDTTPLYVGDPVALTGESSNGVAIVTRFAGGAAQTGALVGVVVGVELINLPNDNAFFRPAGEVRTVYVADDPNLEFEIQEDAVGGKIAAGAVGGTIQLAAGDGSATTKASGFSADSSEAATTATDSLRILGIVDPESAFPLLRVMINNHQLANGLAGV